MRDAKACQSHAYIAICANLVNILNRNNPKAHMFSIRNAVSPLDCTTKCMKCTKLRPEGPYSGSMKVRASFHRLFRHPLSHLPATEAKPCLQKAGPEQMLSVGKTFRLVGASFGVELSHRRGECRNSTALNPEVRSRETDARASVVGVPHTREVHTTYCRSRSTLLANPVNKSPMRCPTFASNKYLQLHLQECVFTGVRTAALADVLTVNKHIHNIDVRGCKGGRFAGGKSEKYKQLPKGRGLTCPTCLPDDCRVAGEGTLRYPVRTRYLNR